MALRYMIPKGGAAATATSAASAAAGAALGLGSRAAEPASCDYQPDLVQGVRLVELDSSWEDVLAHSAAPSKAASGGSAPSRSSSLHSAADAAAHAAPAAQGAVVQDDVDTPAAVHAAAAGSKASAAQALLTFSLAPPTRDETSRAMEEVESMLQAGARRSRSFLASSGSSSGGASASLELSEHALLRYQSVVAGGEEELDDLEYFQHGGADGAPPSSVRMGQHPLAASSSAARSLALSASSSALLAAQAEASVSSKLLHVLDSNRAEVSGLLANESLWRALIDCPEAQQILQKHGAAAPPPAASESRATFVVEEDKGSVSGESAGPAARGWWQFFSAVQTKILGIASTFAQLFSKRAATEEPKERRSVKEEAVEDTGKAEWAILGGVLAVVVLVAFVVILKRPPPRLPRFR